ncbi:probable ATP-dependent RNA helicase DDX46 [Episyrphus balteatus]|uniref:probable ATP-dependent RNA helicase DDX46 n=1 Tax=Episyrphus balteatus TaxID=286459 RepID=UPI0024862BBD|nr:probable ATP-dependent RNA helicase DDX46 [Episyrphus balteatus]
MSKWSHSTRDRDRERRRYSRSRSRSPQRDRKRNDDYDRQREDSSSKRPRDNRDNRKREETKRRRHSPPPSSRTRGDNEGFRSRGSAMESSSDRHRDRDRDRERDRDRDRHRDRDRQKDRERNERSNASPVKEKVIEKIKIEPEPKESPEKEIDKEEEQRQLELEMIKRRERIECWRAERKLKELEANKKDFKSLILPTQANSKKWSLEDESDDEEDKDSKDIKDIKLLPPIVEEQKPPKEEPESEETKEISKKEEEEIQDDIDPLDAYMQEVAKEVRKINNIVNPSSTTDSSGVLIMTGIVKKTSQDVSANKGELIEQNQDSLDYSSDDDLENIKDTAANLANKHKKELAKINHADVDYAPFRKNFYVEVPELAKMKSHEVEKYRVELEGIQVKGKGCPKPIKTWAQCGVSRKEMDVLRKLNFENPTPIQCQAIPAIMSGRDLIGIAKTGSGKTLAFILPMFRHILDQPQMEDGDGPISIIMAPTRELCMQIGKDIKRFSKALNLRAVCVYGGTGISEQIAELKRGAEIIVCTPGRMIDMLAANSGRVTNLRRVTYIVLDEADRMFDMGFEPQVMRIIDNVRPDRQTVMFSATFPRQMEALARRILKKPIEVIVGGRSVVCKDVEQNVAILEDDAKFFKLLELLGVYQEQGSIIVFVDKQENADIVLKDLMKASYPCMSLHGGIDQFDRDSTILDFKSGKVRLLIATSVAARGLDVKDLILVINYDCPNHYEDYVHRCGRTGRAGNKGKAWTFLTPEQGRYAGDIIRALELSETPVPEDLKKLWEDYKALQEAEGKKVHSGGGFSGKGFKFDEQEANAAKESKKLQKAALGLADSDDDEDIEQDIDQQIEQLFAAKRNIKETSVAPVIPAPTAATVTMATAGVPAATLTPLSTTTTPTTATAMTIAAAGGSDKLELAKKLASKINTARNLTSEIKPPMQQQAATELIMKGTQSQPMITARTVVEQLAAKLNNKLNYQPKDDEDCLSPLQQSSFTKYEEELEINDFPQQARWKVTSKEALAQISEYSEAGLTVRGTYVPTGKNPPEGERKLYLAIESCSEMSVQKAKREITRLIKEELLKLSSAHHVFNKGRYKVV